MQETEVDPRLPAQAIADCLTRERKWLLAAATDPIALPEATDRDASDAVRGMTSYAVPRGIVYVRDGRETQVPDDAALALVREPMMDPPTLFRPRRGAGGEWRRERGSGVTGLSGGQDRRLKFRPRPDR